MITAVFITQIIILAVILTTFFYARTFRFQMDVKQMSRLMAAQLLHDFRDDIHILEQSGTRQRVRQKYLTMCNELGLPTSAVDTIEKLVWKRVHQAQGDEPTKALREFALYD